MYAFIFEHILRRTQLMRLILCENYEEMSKAAAKIVASQMILKPDSILGLATGSTPVMMYDILSQMNKSGEIDFSEAKSFNLDEYYPLSADNDQSYHYFMDENLFSKINIQKENTYILDGMAKSPQEECADFEKKIDASGGIDLQILGIGQNGHIGFNEPDSSLNSKTHLTDLTESTINANSRFFASYDDVPKQALTMGIGTILKAKKIILMASGANKHRVVKELLEGEINTDIPASMLKLHSDVILICDRAAYQGNRMGIDIGVTDIKFGVIDNENKIIYRDSIPTNKDSEEALIDEIADKCQQIMSEHNITRVGVAISGSIENGCVTACNLPFNNTKLEKILSKKLGVNVSVANDANCAALGEVVCGNGKEKKNVIAITLGTGIGGGIVINNKLYEGKGGAGNIGHLCIEANGIMCSCGAQGCWEQYASVSALCKAAIEAAQKNQNSELYKAYKENNEMNGKLFFSVLKKNCAVAKEVFEVYLDYLAKGIKSLICIFAPDMIVLAGGIVNEGDALLKPLLRKLGPTDTTIEISSLKSDVGIFGAAMLQ